MERDIWERADSSVYGQIWSEGAWPTYSNSRLSPGSDVAAEMAAAFAISSLLFGKVVQSQISYSSLII